MQQQPYSVHQAWSGLFNAPTREGLQRNMIRFVSLSEAEQRFVQAHLSHTLLLQLEQLVRQEGEQFGVIEALLRGQEEHMLSLHALLVNREESWVSMSEGDLGLPRAATLPLDTHSKDDGQEEDTSPADSFDSESA